jgi:hypothetical protein
MVRTAAPMDSQAKRVSAERFVEFGIIDFLYPNFLSKVSDIYPPYNLALV